MLKPTIYCGMKYVVKLRAQFRDEIHSLVTCKLKHLLLVLKLIHAADYLLNLFNFLFYITVVLDFRCFFTSSAILQTARAKPVSALDRVLDRCPVVGCGNLEPITEDHLRDDTDLIRHLARKQRHAKKPDNKR